MSQGAGLEVSKAIGHVQFALCFCFKLGAVCYYSSRHAFMLPCFLPDDNEWTLMPLIGPNNPSF